ncbi:hypothetical protein GCM10009623_33600 [Nocardioides aestuarii]|uniref:Aminoglycoside phosphotransferase domain-containing protein n=1 Tax=Nocardioides aestuarii TaxID=252231 RepID=A0ABW4TSH6_9ACTN
MPSVPPPTRDTAVRLEWHVLPRPLRDAVAARCGSPVVAAHSRTRGFTPGFASVLECEDGSRHFVKAASLRAQRMFATAYREEARKLAVIPAEVPAPALQWVMDDEWVVLGIDHLEGRHPARPWRREELDACLDSLEVVATELTPPPEGLVVSDAVDDLAPFLEHWEVVRTAPPDLPLLAEHLDEAVELARGYAAVVGGDTVVHSDLRDDNVLIDGAGRAWFCDWNFPVRGASWLDSLLLLIGPRGDGLDVDQVIAARPLLRDVPADGLDAVIALVTGYFLKSMADPVPPTSPRVRDHQRWQAEVCWEWLCQRRGWGS